MLKQLQKWNLEDYIIYEDSKNVKIIKIFQPEVGQMAFKLGYISFLELFEHFYFWALLESPENFGGLDAKLNVLENFQKFFWWTLLA